MSAVIPYAVALDIARRFADEIAGEHPGMIRAVFAIGSLGSDYYRPGQSDIDTAVITSCSRADLPAVSAAIGKIADRYFEEYHIPKGFGAIVFAGEQLYPPYIKEEELVLEIMRLKVQSRLLWGSYDIAAVPMPGQEAIIEDACAFEEWLEGEMRRDPEFGVSNVTMLVNSTLMILKRWLMIACGVVEFNKFKVIGEYLRREPPFIEPELFLFIESALRGEAAEPDAGVFARLKDRHDALYEAINVLIL